jgi:hypothetical protein
VAWGDRQDIGNGTPHERYEEEEAEEEKAYDYYNEDELQKDKQE